MLAYKTRLMALIHGCLAEEFEQHEFNRPVPCQLTLQYNNLAQANGDIGFAYMHVMFVLFFSTDAVCQVVTSKDFFSIELAP